MTTPSKEKLLDLIAYLNHGLVERDGTLKAALLSLLAGENLLLVGPPGTAKSLIARKVADCLKQDDTPDQAGGVFEYLLTKFSTPEEIFGPLSISELKADRFKRNTAGYLPSVRMAFLDEIFKASSSILNALLTILNERIYHNGSEAQKVPLQALIAASNELPTGQEELDALYDRFLVRSFVDYVSDDNLPRLLDKPGAAPTITPLSSEDLVAIRQAAEAIILPADIVSAIQKIWAGHKQLFKEDRRENLSDRRLRKVAGLLCISAATNGRKEVDLSDLLLLKDCLWNHPDNALKVRELVMNTLRVFSRPLQLSDSEQQPLLESTAKQQNEADHTSMAQMNVVVKGYKGRGTARDPILVETVHDLAGLERPEIGQKGYHFRQAADINCKKLTTWLKIDFQGHYDGSGFSIDYRGSKDAHLFERVNKASHLSNLRLKGVGLARTISGSKIIACTSNTRLLGVADDCTINACESGAELMQGVIKCSISYCRSASVLVSDTATECAISICQAKTNLIVNTASACTIQDCQVQSSVDGCRIAGKLKNNSIVERCFVSEGVL